MTSALSGLDSEQIASCQAECDAACMKVRLRRCRAPCRCVPEAVESVPGNCFADMTCDGCSAEMRKTSAHGNSFPFFGRPLVPARSRRSTNRAKTARALKGRSRPSAPLRQGALGDVPAGLDATESATHHFLVELACFARSVSEKGAAAKGLVTGARSAPQRAFRALASCRSP